MYQRVSENLVVSRRKAIKARWVIGVYQTLCFGTASLAREAPFRFKRIEQLNLETPTQKLPSVGRQIIGRPWLCTVTEELTESPGESKKVLVWLTAQNSTEILDQKSCGTVGSNLSSRQKIQELSSRTDLKMVYDRRSIERHRPGLLSLSPCLSTAEREVTPACQNHKFGSQLVRGFSSI